MRPRQACGGGRPPGADGPKGGAAAGGRARAATEREESRGGHTRDEFPKPDPEWAKLNLICTLNEDRSGIALARKDLPVMPPELAEIFEEQS